MGSRPSGPITMNFREWVQELGFDETTVNAEVRDNRVGAKNTELDGLTIRGNELLVRGYEFPSGLIHQEHEGGICAPPPGNNPLPPPPPGPLLVEDPLHYIVPFGPS